MAKITCCDFCGEMMYPEDTGTVEFKLSRDEEILKINDGKLFFDACYSCRVKMGGYLLSQVGKLSKKRQLKNIRR